MSSEYGELINCDEMHYATVTADTDEAYTASTPKYLCPAAEIKHESKVNTDTRYYDGKPMFTTMTEAEGTITITVSGVPMKLAAELSGKPYKNGMLIDTGDISEAPYCALSGRMELGDGGYRYFQYLKGKFSIGAQDAKTREDKITASTIELTYTAINTVHSKFDVDSTKYPNGKSIKGLFADTTDETFTGAADWFTAVQKPADVAAG